MHQKTIGDEMEKIKEIIDEAIRILEDYNPNSMLSRDRSRFDCIDFLKNNRDKIK